MSGVIAQAAPNASRAATAASSRLVTDPLQISRWLQSTLAITMLSRPSLPAGDISFFTTQGVANSVPNRSDLSSVGHQVANRMLNRWDAALDFTEAGRPKSTDPLFDVGISHSHGVGAVIVACGGTVGIDLERGTWRCSSGFVRRTCTNQETRWVTEGRDPGHRCKLLWTRKEAVLKLLGLGLREKPSSIDVSGPYVDATRLGSTTLFLQSWIRNETILSLASTVGPIVVDQALPMRNGKGLRATRTEALE